MSTLIQGSTVATTPVTYSAAPAYSAAPVTYAAAPATYAAAPATYAAAPATYAAAPAYTATSQPVTTFASQAPTMSYIQASPQPVTTISQQPVTTIAQQPITTMVQQPVTMLQGLTFQTLATQKMTPERQRWLRQAFHAADRDGSGELDANELAPICQQLGLGGCDAGTLASRFAEFDTNGNGKVSFSEFMASFHPKPFAPGPKHHEGSYDAENKWVDGAFPPNNNSIYASPNPAADHVSDVQGHAGGAGVQVEWKRVSELCGGDGSAALFNSVHPNDIAQGILGDCWFLAALAGLAEFEGAVFSLFQEKKYNPNCQYTINIYNCQSKCWDSVTIDDYVPVVRGEPLMAKPQDHEMWVLLLEKAFAKWFGSYCQIQGAYCMVAFMLLVDCAAPCKVFTQSMNGQPPFNKDLYHVVNASLQDPKNRNSVGLSPQGQINGDMVWQELVAADEASHIMAAWTGKDPAVSTGVGASGEIIASDGIVKGHAYSLISAREVTRDDGQIIRLVQLRNPWGANPAAEYKGEYSDTWDGWVNYPQMKNALLGEGGKIDGIFWMSFDNFRERYSDCGIVPKEMPTARMGAVQEDAKPGQKHGRRVAAAPIATYAAPPSPASPAKPKKTRGKKKTGCC